MRLLIFILVVIGAALIFVIVPSRNQGGQLQNLERDLKTESYFKKTGEDSRVTDVNLKKATTAIEEAVPSPKPPGDSGFAPRDFQGPTTPPSVIGPSGNPPDY